MADKITLATQKSAASKAKMTNQPNISIGSITGGQNNIGETNIAGDQVMNVNSGVPISATEFVDLLQKAIGQIDGASSPEAEESIAELKAVAQDEQPESPRVDSAINRFRQLVAERGPEFGAKLFKGVVAGLKAGVASHPLVGPIVAFLSSFVD